ncbi:RND efflux system, inner membrane transporter CmeB [Chitinispirillum alkaliphilum]|nr:RND efflux system, inner membrane transporter CmeB [Chitinispirillum alkaliphilum]
MIVLLCSQVFAENGINVTPYGLAHYRLRTRIRSAFTDDAQSTVFDYVNNIAYYAGFTATVGPRLTFQFQIGNDWIFTEDVNYLNNNPVVPQRQFPPGIVPHFHLAFAHYDAGTFNFTAGVVPLVSHGPLDLIERSISTGTYETAAFFTWPVITNNSFMGLKFGLPVVSDETMRLDFNLFSTVIDSRLRQLTDNDSLIETPNRNPSSVMFVFDAPFTVGRITFTPQVVGIVNRNYNQFREEGDHEYSGGMSAFFNVTERISISTYAAYAEVNNLGSRNHIEERTALVSSPQLSPQYENRGFIAGLGSRIGIGPGTLVIDFKYSYADDRRAENSEFNYLFGDLMYSWNFHPNYMLTPRIRNFTTINPDGSSVTVLMENRPELILSATF